MVLDASQCITSCNPHNHPWGRWLAPPFSPRMKLGLKRYKATCPKSLSDHRCGPGQCDNMSLTTWLPPNSKLGSQLYYGNPSQLILKLTIPLVALRVFFLDRFITSVYSFRFSPLTEPKPFSKQRRATIRCMPAATAATTHSLRGQHWVTEDLDRPPTVPTLWRQQKQRTRAASLSRIQRWQWAHTVELRLFPVRLPDSLEVLSPWAPIAVD